MKCGKSVESRVKGWSGGEKDWLVMKGIGGREG